MNKLWGCVTLQYPQHLNMYNFSSLYTVTIFGTKNNLSLDKSSIEKKCTRVSFVPQHKLCHRSQAVLPKLVNKKIKVEEK